MKTIKIAPILIAFIVETSIGWFGLIGQISEFNPIPAKIVPVLLFFFPDGQGMILSSRTLIAGFAWTGPGDEAGLLKLQVNLTCEPEFSTKSLFPGN